VTHLRVARDRADLSARWIHILLLTMLVIVALYLANIPLTVFAFMGGEGGLGQQIFQAFCFIHSISIYDSIAQRIGWN